MKTKLIACEMLRPEIEAIQKETETNYDTIWIEPGLHSTPQLLNGHLKEIFEQLSDCDRVLMPFGDCGGALKRNDAREAKENVNQYRSNAVSCSIKERSKRFAFSGDQ